MVPHIHSTLFYYNFVSEAEFHAFLSKYKVQEGKIHNLWTQILNEQDKLVVCRIFSLEEIDASYSMYF